MNDYEIKNILLQKGVKPSFHRMKILEYLFLRKNHPTVDVIYRDISGEIPTLSKTTIYNTLKLLYEKNIVRMITIEENEVKYDATVSNHAHLKCLRCGKLYDLTGGARIPDTRSLEGHQILETHLYYKGICKQCRN